MKAEKEQYKNSITILKKVFRFIGKYRFLLMLSLFLTFVTVLFQLYVPVLFGHAIDQITGTGQVDFSHMWSYLRQILLLILISGCTSWLMNIINNRMTFCTVRDIRAKAIRHIHKLPFTYLDSQSTGDIISRVINDADILSDGLLLGFTQLFSGIITILGTLIFMLSKNVLITLLVIVLTPLSFFVAKFISTHTFQMFQKQSNDRGAQTALIEEIIGEQKLVQAFGYEASASERFDKLNRELKDSSLKAVFFSSLTNPCTRFVNNIIYAAVALTGAFLIPHGALTVGGLSVMLAYANQYMKPFNEISSVITELQNALACASRIFSLLEEAPETPDGEKELSEVKGNVVLDQVTFQYKPDKPLIRNINLTASTGKRIAIVGPTGCGKTTFINLLMRFYDADSGLISIDGIPINMITRHSLRKCYGMVLQDTWIKAGTVRDNITLGNSDASEEQVILAAKRSHSWEFIRRLPNGLDTYIDENSLSQGQKQLLCITRVMLCHPPMLILDEATSSIDTRTEMLVQEAFDRLMQGRTSFIVAHRLSTIRNADLILVMKDGNIVEQGTHKELIAKGGFYNTLYNSQFKNSAEV